ncbi:MAG: hypothetical protein KAY37_14850 [Phycisphaerae bacterium]|nr:hypothetical protein [Phycisphaerae bacterium]
MFESRLTSAAAMVSCLLGLGGAAHAEIVITTVGPEDGYVVQQMGVGYTVYDSRNWVASALTRTGGGFTDQYISRGILEFALDALDGTTIDNAFLELTLFTVVTPQHENDFPEAYGKLTQEDGTIDVNDISLSNTVDLGRLPGSPGSEQPVGTVYQIDVTDYLQDFVTANGVFTYAGFVLDPGGAFNTTGDEFYFASSESTVYNGPTLRINTPPDCPGDSNCDGAVSWRDIDFFVAAMNDNVAAWEAMFLPGTPSCPFENNDVNADGTVSWRDIDPFVAIMNTTCP